VEDAERGIHTEILLTSDTFADVRGHEDRANSTEYEIYLYDATGRAMGVDGVARRQTVGAMQATVIAARELIGQGRPFWGGMKIRLRPRGRDAMHASDLFSSAFVRWHTADSFDNVHANPDPPQWQNTGSYYYSMPFPALATYECFFSLFNPYADRSAGELLMQDEAGRPLTSLRYELKAHSSLLFHLNTGRLVSDPGEAFKLLRGKMMAESPAMAARATSSTNKAVLPARGHGLLSVTNQEGTAKGFGYLMIRQPARARFSVEHPIHQSHFKPRPSVVPLDANNDFRARNMLFSPLVFRAKRIGQLTLESRFYFATGLPLEEALWLYPFVRDGAGTIPWAAMDDEQLAARLPGQTERGLIRLPAGQSCALDCAQLPLPTDFSGGLSLGVSPDISHTLMKVEVRVPEWGAHAFTHFRPGLRSARLYQQPKERGGLATDYIAAGARLLRGPGGLRHDELIGVMNIDDQNIAGRPVIELFGPRGLVKRLPLGALPGMACRHYLLSELLPGAEVYETLQLRLVDEKATLLMSVVHLDYARRDLALDHGSDRFSTFLDYVCK